MGVADADVRQRYPDDQRPPIPADEAARLASLRALQILDTPSEERFDRIVRLAQRIFGVPMALVSLRRRRAVSGSRRVSVWTPPRQIDRSASAPTRS